MATNTVYVFAMKDGKYAFKTEIRHVIPEFSAHSLPCVPYCKIHLAAYCLRYLSKEEEFTFFKQRNAYPCKEGDFLKVLFGTFFLLTIVLYYHLRISVCACCRLNLIRAIVGNCPDMYCCVWLIVCAVWYC
jgi:hypothetical protein